MIRSAGRAIAALLCVSSAASAQEHRALAIEEALGALAITNRMPVDLSPDGEWVAYTLEDPGRQEPTGGDRYKDYTPTGAYREAVACDVWIANTRTGEARNLTGGQGTSSNPVWSPDGRYLAFYSDRGGTYRLWLWERATGRSRQFSDLIPRPYFGFAGVRWSADSKRVVLKALPEEMTVEQAADLVTQPKAPPPRRPGSTVTLYEGSAPTGVTGATGERGPYYLADIAVADVPSGSVHRVARRVHAVGYWISPDGQQVAYTDHLGLGVANTQQNAYELTIASVADGARRVLASNVFMDYGVSVSWSPDGASIAYTTAGQMTRVGELHVVPIAGGDARRISLGQHPSLGQSYLAPLWDAKGQHIYLPAAGALWRSRVADGSTVQVARIPERAITHVVSKGNNAGRLFSPDGRSAFVTTRSPTTKQVGVYKIDLTTGADSAMFERDQFFSTPLWTIDVSDDGRTAVYVAQDAQHGEDVWVAGPGFRDTRRLTRINPQLDRVVFGASRMISWTTERGDTLRGALLMPSRYEAGKRYPMVVKLYAGSSLSDRVFRFGGYGGGVENLQLLATRGYAVLLPDVRQRLGTPMKDIVAAVLPGLDKVIELGIADPDQLGVTGQSYGGYAVLSLIVQTNRFRAAISNAGPADLIGIYGKLYADGRANGVGWAETGQGLMGGTPWQMHERYIANSPITYLDKVETPLLLVHGGLDRSVPTWQSEAVFVGLRRLGRDVVYARYEGEDHYEGTWGRANAVDYWNRVIGWFDKHLKIR